MGCYFLDSERSDGIYWFYNDVYFVFFFVSVITFWGSKNALIFLNSNFSERKVNVDGTLAC
jgi:hypothetical protein